MRIGANICTKPFMLKTDSPMGRQLNYTDVIPYDADQH